MVRESPPWAVDAWGLGCLMQELYSGAQLQRTEDLRSTDQIPKDMLPHYQVGLGAPEKGRAGRELGVHWEGRKRWRGWE